MSIKDYILIGISIMALSISIFTFWFPYFYKPNELLATVVSMDINQDKPLGELKINVPTIFVNTGQRNNALVEVNLCIQYKAKQPRICSNEGINELFILKPGDVKQITFRFRIVISDFSNNVYSDTNDIEYNILIGFALITDDSEKIIQYSNIGRLYLSEQNGKFTKSKFNPVQINLITGKEKKFEEDHWHFNQ